MIETIIDRLLLNSRWTLFSIILIGLGIYFQIFETVYVAIALFLFILLFGDRYKEDEIKEYILFRLFLNGYFSLVIFLIIGLGIYFQIFETVYVAVVLILLLFIFGKKYDKYGFDYFGHTADDTNFVDGYDKHGFDRFGYNKYGFNEFGMNEKGFDKDGYDYDGFNLAGLNSRNETKKEEKERKVDREIETVLKEIENVNYKIARLTGNISYTREEQYDRKYLLDITKLEAELNTLNAKLKALSR